jgi:hypothetical protein
MGGHGHFATLAPPRLPLTTMLLTPTHKSSQSSAYICWMCTLADGVEDKVPQELPYVATVASWYARTCNLVCIGAI